MNALIVSAPLALVLAVLGVTLPAHAADAGKGAQLYGAHCTSCHGRNGVAVMPGAPNFSRNEGLMQPDFALIARIRAGKNACPGYAGILKDAEIHDTIAYMRTLWSSRSGN